MKWLLFSLAFCLLQVVGTAQSWQKCTLPAGFNPSGSSSTYLDVFFLPSNPQYGWVCGFNGYVLRTTDGGTSWQGTIVPYNGRSGGHLESVQFVTPQIGYCSGTCGIFKSTDGGANWVDLTSHIPSGNNYWGLYFLNDQWGVLVGGGCNTSQYFYLTSDGGASFSVFNLNVAVSGMTDLILYPDGSGVAVGSGHLYQTLDSGRTWAPWQTPFPNIWDEELTISGNSIVVSVAGQDCAGGGSTAGGARFSTDQGQSWTSFATNAAFYGAFLTNSTTAWICGNNRNMWRTTNSGQNWELKNCGVDGDLDDVWFINDTTGFVVGNGVYRYSPAVRSISKNVMDFGSMCFPGTKYDTLWVRNRSFNGTSATWSISGLDFQHYSVLQPLSTNFGISSCDSTMIVVRFQPKSTGAKSITLNVGFSDGTTLSTTIFGSSGGNNTNPIDTLVSIPALQVGVPIRVSVGFSNNGSQTDQIIAVTKLSGTVFKQEGAVPYIVPPGGSSVGFTVTLADTGWQVGRYLMRVGPCIHDTIITLKAYGISPIINVPATRIYTSQCLGVVYDTIPVENTGNSDLIVNNAYIAVGSSEFTIMGWLNGETLPVTIPKGQRKYIVLRFQPAGGGVSAATLRFASNDATTARGVKTPIDVQLQGTSSGISSSISKTTVDFGIVCPGQSATQTVVLRNTGTAEIIVDQLNLQSNYFLLSCSKTLAAHLAPGDSLVWTIQFPNSPIGVYQDSLILVFDPCGGARVGIPIRAIVQQTLLQPDPSLIDTTLKTGVVLSKMIRITNIGGTDATIDNIVLSPSRSEWTLLNLPSLPLNIKAGAFVDIEFQAGSSAEIDMIGTLTVTTSVLCSTAVSIPIHVRVSQSQVSLSKNSVLSPAQRCTRNPMTDEIVISNAGGTADTLVLAEIRPASAASVFSLLPVPQLPLLIEKDKPQSLKLNITQQTQGVDSATLVLRFASAFSASEVYVPLRAENSASVLKVDTTMRDFGVLERCDPVAKVTLSVDNSGLLADTLSASFVLADPSLSALPTLVVAANATSSLTVSLDPSILPERLVNDTLVLRSLVCGEVFRIPLRALLRDPHLDITPSVLHYGSVWRGDTQAKLVSIVNRSSAARVLKSIRVVSSMYQTLSVGGPVLPYTLNPGDSLAIPIELKADSTGQWNSSIEIIDHSSCWDTTSVDWDVVVPKEVYSAQLSVRSDVLVKVGGTADLAVVLSTSDSSRDALFRAQPSSLDFDLEFNDAIMNLLSVHSYKDGVRTQLSFNKGPESVHISVPADRVRKLGASDTILILHVEGLQHVPNNTIVHAANARVDVDASKEVHITTDDCTFAVQGCLLWVGVQLAEPFSVQLAGHPADEQLGLSIEHSASSSLRWEFFNSTGATVQTQSAEIGSVPAHITIPTNALSSGLYMLRLSNSAGQEQRMMVIVQH